MPEPWTQESWQKLLRCLRPGSRTILYRPESVAPAVDLARRGYRLLLVTDDAKLKTDCRRVLREQGLQSQLMGIHDHSAGRPLRLADEFYDLMLCFEPLGVGLDEMAPFLTPMGLVVLGKALDHGEDSGLFQKEEKVPAPYRAFRLV
jgi:hypothetical protein